MHRPSLLSSKSLRFKTPQTPTPPPDSEDRYNGAVRSYSDPCMTPTTSSTDISPESDMWSACVRWARLPSRFWFSQRHSVETSDQPSDRRPRRLWGCGCRRQRSCRDREATPHPMKRKPLPEGYGDEDMYSPGAYTPKD
jgi:hypothetical protein